jgi:RNA polymerase sigma-70 factor (sigma-E family)
VGSFDESFAGLYAAAYRVAFRLLGDRTEAEDVAQEALARTYVRWRTVAPYAAPWACRVATNVAIDRTRRDRRRAAGDVPERAGGDAWADERVDLQRALRTLPRRQRDVVVLRYLADQPEDAVAAALGVSVGSVKTHASRGLAALRARLGDARVGS